MSTVSSPVRAQTSFQNAARLNRSFTAAAEKRLLIWMAHRTPKTINSDHLTALGFIAQLLAGVSYALAPFNRFSLVLVSCFIVLNWLGDSLDGTLARVRNCQRPRYGFYVDHVLDSFGGGALMLGLAFSGYVDFRIALGMLAAFLLLSCETYLATYALGRFHMSQTLFGPTEIRLLLILGNTVLLFRPYARLFGREFPLFDVGGGIATMLMVVMAIVAATRHTVELYRQETHS